MNVNHVVFKKLACWIKVVAWPGASEAHSLGDLVIQDALWSVAAWDASDALFIAASFFNYLLQNFIPNTTYYHILTHKNINIYMYVYKYACVCVCVHLSLTRHLASLVCDFTSFACHISFHFLKFCMKKMVIV